MKYYQFSIKPNCVATIEFDANVWREAAAARCHEEQHGAAQDSDQHSVCVSICFSPGSGEHRAGQATPKTADPQAPG